MFGLALVFFSEDYCSIFEGGISDSGARTAASSEEQLPIQGSPPYSMHPPSVGRTMPCRLVEAGTGAMNHPLGNKPQAPAPG